MEGGSGHRHGEPIHGAPIHGAQELADASRLRRWRLFWFGAMGFVAMLIVGAIAAGLASQPHPGHHRHIAAGLIAIGVVAVVLAVIAIGGWRIVNHDQSWLRLQRFPWRVRRRAMADLRKGRPITAENQDVARALIDFHQRRWFAGLLVVVGLLWVLNSVLAHGNGRWIDVGLALLYFGVTLAWLRMRRRILRRAVDLPAAIP